jgi:transposase
LWRARGIGFWRGSPRSPDLTLRALLKELADRGLVVSYYALWHFLQHEGVTFKKKPSRLRTGPAGRRQAA